MFKKIIWLSIANIKRRASISILFFIITLVISSQFFLIQLTSSFLSLPQSSGIKGFFYTIGLTSIILTIVTTPIISILYSKSRYNDYIIYKIFGNKKIDIIMLFTFEIFLLAIAGSLIGSAIVVLFISFKVIYLPDFFQNVKQVWPLKLISITVKSISGVSLSIAAISFSTFFINFKDEILSISGIGE